MKDINFEGYYPPFAVRIENGTNSTHEIDLLGSYEYLTSKYILQDGSLEKDGVRVSSNVKNVTYQEILYQFLNNPARIRLIYVDVIADNIDYAVREVGYWNKLSVDPRGTRATEPLRMLRQPSGPKNILAHHCDLTVDGYTKFTIVHMPPRTTVFVYLFMARPTFMEKVLDKAAGIFQRIRAKMKAPYNMSYAG